MRKETQPKNKYPQSFDEENIQRGSNFQDNGNFKEFQPQSERHLSQIKSLNEPTKSSMSKRCYLTKTYKIVIGVTTAVLIATIIGLSIALAIHLKPQIKQTGVVKEIKMEDGTKIEYSEFILEMNKILNPKRQVTMIQSQITPSHTVKSRLLQEGEALPAVYTNTINIKDYGIKIKMFPDQSIKVAINQKKLLDYLITNYPEILDEAQGQESRQKNKKEILQIFKNIFSQYFSEYNKEGKNVFQQKSFIDYCLNPASNLFQPKCPKKDARRMLGFFSDMWKKAKNIFNKGKQKLQPIIKVAKDAKDIFDKGKQAYQKGKQVIQGAKGIWDTIKGLFGSDTQDSQEDKSNFQQSPKAEQIINNCFEQSASQILCQAKTLDQEQISEKLLQWQNVEQP